MAWLSWIASNVLLALLLAVAAWLAQRWLRRPGLARVLWLLVLVKLITPPVVSLPVGHASGRMACAFGYCTCGQHATARLVFHDTLPWVLLAVWSAGAVAMTWTLCRRWRRFRNLIDEAEPAPRQWQRLAARLSAELRLRRPPQILAVPGRLPPLVVAGLGRSRMLIPGELIHRLNARQRKALMLHELTHIRRGDHWARFVELVVGVVFWWLPITRAIGRQLRACEEACCDRAVVTRLPAARYDYARLLLDVLDFASPLPLPAAPSITAMSTASNLETRLLAILDDTSAAHRARPVGILALGVALAILPCGFHYDLPVPAADSRHLATVQLDEVGCPTSLPEPPASAAAERARGAACEVKPPVFPCPSRK